MSVPLHYFVDLTGNDINTVHQQIQSDCHKFFQSVRTNFHVERIPPQFYDDLAGKE